MPPALPPLKSGTTLGYWTILAGPTYRQRMLWYVCRCRCGTEREVRARELREGNSQSCGCYHREIMRALNTTHGLSDTPEYAVWRAMIERCTVPTHPEYHLYGGRGIQVCGAWRENFATFLNDVGRRPSPHHSIDRIDNNGHYEPRNVRWATALEQSLNTRRVRRHTYHGESLTIREWSERIGISYETLRHRIMRLHWPIPRALSEPLSLVHQRCSRCRP